MHARPYAEPIRAVSQIAESQHGVFTLDQASAAGLSRSTLWDRMRAGLYRRAHDGVYLVAGSPDSWERWVVATVLSEEEPSAASHQTAAYLHGLIDRKGGVIHVVTRRWLRRPRSGIRVHESTDLTESDIEIVNGIPTTNPTRTVVDLGATTPWLVSGALGTALRAGKTDLDQIDSFVARVARRGRRGVGVIRPLIKERRAWQNATESELEDRFAKLVDDFGLPRPEPQYVLRDNLSAFVCRADFAYPASRVLIELDGFAHHGDEETFQRDRTKQNRAQLLGWSMLRYTWSDVNDRPGHVAAEIRSSIAQ